MAEGNFGNEIDKSLALSATRDRLGRSSADETKSAIELLHPRFTSLLEDEFFSLHVGTLNILEESKKKSEKTSNPRLCASLIQRFIDNRCLERLNAAQESKRDKNFRYFFDLKAGVDLTLSSIAQAESEISDAGEKTSMAVADKNSKLDDQIDAYLALRKTNAKYLEFLRRDNTGFLLVDNMVETIGTDNSEYIDFNWSKEYVLAGAKLARNFYKKLYGIAESQDSKQQPK